MGGMCQIMDSGLRLYGHPDLLAVAASINGDDCARYNGHLRQTTGLGVPYPGTKMG